jgi:hypothetical protein
VHLIGQAVVFDNLKKWDKRKIDANAYTYKSPLHKDRRRKFFYPKNKMTEIKDDIQELFD